MMFENTHKIGLMVRIPSSMMTSHTLRGGAYSQTTNYLYKTGFIRFGAPVESLSLFEVNFYVVKCHFHMSKIITFIN